jgi:hypothetical protein
MRFRWIRPFDHVSLAGLAGMIASLFASMTLDRLNVIVGIGVGLISMGYVGTRWFLLWKINARIIRHPLAGPPAFPPVKEPPESR